MTKSKTVLFGGVIFVVATGAFAGQRTRGGQSVRDGGTGSVAAPEFQEIAPGVAQRTVNGVTTTADSRNLIGLEDVIEAYGSIEQYKASVTTANMDGMPDGDRIVFESGIVGYAEGYADPADLPADPAVLQAAHQSKVGGSPIVDSNGNTAGVMFSDGMVGIGTDARDAAEFRSEILTVDGVSADGMVAF